MLSHVPNAVNPPHIKPRVAFQGTFGAFSERAIAMHWPSGAEAIPCDAFADVLIQLTHGHVDAAVLPVFNAIAGNVVAAVSALDGAGARVTIVSSLHVPIDMCLMAPPDATLDLLRAVSSHPIALAQCRSFFAQHTQIVRQPHIDTAGAARDVAASGDISCGAIAGEAAASRYGLKILARAIQDVPDNWTRFVVLIRAA